MWRSRFCKAYNLKYKKTFNTFYSKQDLYCQLVPSLEMTFALRDLYGIEGGKGQILNLDESMTYKVEKTLNTGVINLTSLIFNSFIHDPLP